MTDFYLAALEYHKMGYTAIALTKDAQGFPKRPIMPAWAQTPHSLEAVTRQPWEDAHGLGLVLGPASNNLAVLDIDDEDLAAVAAKRCNHTRVVQTIRHRCHVYVRERTPSRSKKLDALWKGRPVCIELKGQGTQVACPPTPGYALLSEAEPREVDSLWVAWEGLARTLSIDAGKGNGYPKPWQEKVAAGGRNMSAYVEAHRLREAGMPIALTLEYMQIRWERHYEKGETEWDEVARTVESAYAKGSHPPISDVYTDLEWT